MKYADGSVKKMVVTKAIYQGKGRVEAEHVRSGVLVTTDAGKAVGGLGENQNPVQLLGNALSACVLTLMGLQAERGGVDFSGCYAEVGECKEDMEKFTVTRIPNYMDNEDRSYLNKIHPHLIRLSRFAELTNFLSPNSRLIDERKLS